MLARNGERLAALAAGIPDAHGHAWDVTDTAALDATLQLVCDELGKPAVPVHSAVGGAFGTFADEI